MKMMFNQMSHFIVIVTTTLLLSIVDCCQYLQFSPKHTLCSYYTPACPLKTKGISKYDIQLIVNEHNIYRQKVANGQQKQSGQPQAADMRQLEWDNELAMMAQRWAEQCKTQHDCSDCRELPRFRVGQNIYMFASTEDNATADWSTAIYEWYKEVSIFSPQKIQPFQNPHAAGHYTQLAWSATYKIGCGFVYFQKDEWFTKLYVCDYGPAGNVLGDKMYVTGTACSACPENTGCSIQFPGLCANGASRSGAVSNFVAPGPVTQKWFNGISLSTTVALGNHLWTPTTVASPQKPWWLTPAASTLRPTWSKSPQRQTKKILLVCDFDVKGCNPETMGATLWNLQRSNTVQGNYYDVQVPEGSDAHLYVYASGDDSATGNGLSAFSKGCVSFIYKKYPLVSQRKSADLDVAVWRHGKSDAYTEFKVTSVVGDWTLHKATVPAFPDVYSVSFHISVPAGSQFGKQYFAVDQIRFDAGPCGN